MVTKWTTTPTDEPTGDFESDQKWTMRFVPTIKQLVGPLLLDVAPEYEDTKWATDFIVLKARSMRIAARVRRPRVDALFHREFTLRSKRDTGSSTELDKITQGWGDWLFYGWATGSDLAIKPWTVIDLDMLRYGFMRCPWMKGQEQKFWGTKANGDGTYFGWFNIERIRSAIDFPAGRDLIIAREGA